MTAMNVIMLLDKNVAAYHNDIKRSKPRTLARQAKEGGSRSKSLSRKEEKSGQSQGQAAVRSRKLSTSNQQLPVLARSKEESVEVPVIVDEVTKWISGVNKSTTCRDIITVILKRSNDQFKVILRFLSLSLAVMWLNRISGSIGNFLPGLRREEVHPV